MKTKNTWDVLSFKNDVSEEQQRWGAKTVEGSGRMEAFR